MTINFDEMKKTTPTIRANGWCKTVTNLDKSTPTGYSIVGDFVTKGKGEMNYADGLYLDCSKPRGQKNYHIFKVENGEPTVLQVLENPQGKWATELWDTIDKALSESPEFTEEYKAQKLANLVLENCNDKSILNQVARIISSEYNDSPIIRNSQMMRGFLNSVASEFPMTYLPLDECSAEKPIQKLKIDYHKYMKEGLLPLQAIFKVYVEEKGYSVEDIVSENVLTDFKILTEFEMMEDRTFNEYWGDHWYFFAGYSPKFIDDFIVLGFRKGNKWNKPTFHIRIFSNTFWQDFLGISDK